MEASPYRCQLVPFYLARLRDTGVDAHALLRRFRLPADAADLFDVTIAVEEAIAFGDAAALRLGEQELGVRLATSLPKGAWGLFEFIVRSAETVRSGISAVVANSHLLNEHVVYALEEGAEVSQLTFRLPAHTACFGRHGNEFTVLFALSLMRTLASPELAPGRVWFSHADPGPSPELRAVLGPTEIHYGFPWNGFSFASRVLDLPLRSADAALQEFLQGQAPKPESHRLDFRARVKKELCALLPQGVPSAERVARRLHMSQRTLQRRLRESGTTFRDLMDEVRRMQTLRLLQEHPRKPRDVALAVGYADTRSFSRAFRRWTGKAIEEFRP